MARLPGINLHVLLAKAIEASFLAAEEILAVYSTDFIVVKKEDHSPVTLADKNANKVIEECLAVFEIPVISEEGRAISFEERKNWEEYWVVDPLDGTKEFVKRNGEFTVNIALVNEKGPVLGVIYSPVKDLLYFTMGKGAYKLDNARMSDIASATRIPLKPQPRPFTIVSSRSHKNPITEKYIREATVSHPNLQTITAGSSVKFCLVAEGIADEYPRFGPTMEWDTAAGHAIARAAGREVYAMDTGEVLKYNKPDLTNPSFIVK